MNEQKARALQRMIISAYMLRDLRLVMFKKIIFFKQSLKEFYCNETNMNYLNQKYL
jgi:hypothetical protein